MAQAVLNSVAEFSRQNIMVMAMVIYLLTLHISILLRIDSEERMVFHTRYHR